MNPKVSIIVPCHNGEKYIKNCFDSIIKNEYSNIEIIAINNCSTDNTENMLKQIAKENSNFKYVDCTKKGVSNARNEGIKFATGDYIQFVDCDDLVTPDCTKKLVDTAVKYDADLVISNFYQNDISTKNNDVNHRCLNAGNYTKKQFIKELSKDPGAHYYGVLWNKLYKSEYIKNDLLFDSKVSLGEDFIFNMSYFSKCSKISVIDDKLYVYTWGVTNSLTNINKSENDRLNEILRLYYSYKNLYENEKLTGFWTFRLHFYIMRSYYNELEHLGDDSLKWKSTIYQKFIKDNNIPNLEFELYTLARKCKQLIRQVMR